MSEAAKHGTAIQWTHGDGYRGETWNPVTGCSKVSPGCAHCYAEALTARYAGRPGWIDEHRPWTPENAAHNVRLRPDRLDQPLRWKRPRMVFVNSMSDLFHEEIPDSYIARVFAVMGAARQHVFQVLTKRPERMRAYLTGVNFLLDVSRVAREMGINPWPGTAWGFPDSGGVFFDDGPLLPNVWLGTSIENRRFVGRADDLRATPAAVRFISAEPLLGPLLPEPVAGDSIKLWDWGKGPPLDLDGIDWLIVGGESGPGHRRIDERWVRDLRDAAAETETAFFFKQWGGTRPKSGGRELDGRTWDEMPEAGR